MSFKTRKLFAILVVTAMVLALLPAAAFAASGPVWGATAVEVDATELQTGEWAEFTLTFLGANAQPYATTPLAFYIKTSRSGADRVTGDAANITFASLTISGADGIKAIAISDEHGQVEFSVSSLFAGTSKITLWDRPATSDGAIKFGEVDLTFTAAKASAAQSSLKLNNSTDAATTPVTVSIYGAFKLKANVKDSNAVPLRNVAVDFQKRYEGGAWSTFATKNTDALGEAEIDVYETVTGDYDYRARAMGVTLGQIMKATVTGAGRRRSPL